MLCMSPSFKQLIRIFQFGIILAYTRNNSRNNVVKYKYHNNIRALHTLRSMWNTSAVLNGNGRTPFTKGVDLANRSRGICGRTPTTNGRLVVRVPLFTVVYERRFTDLNKNREEREARECGTTVRTKTIRCATLTH